MKALKNIHSKFKKGLTLIETLLAISIGSVVIIYAIGFIAEQTYQERMRISAQQVTTINSAFMRRVMHDGLDFDKFTGEGSTITSLEFSGNNEIQDFLDLLTPLNACNNSGLWEPIRTEDGDLLRSTPLISCNLGDNLNNNFGLDFSAVIVKDDTEVARNIIGVKLIIDYSSSELLDRTSTNLGWGVNGPARVIQYMDMIESRLPSDLVGTQRVYLSTIGGNRDDFSSDNYIERNVNECFLGGGEECFIILEINFSGGFNHQYLRTDGLNAMLAPIKFALSGADSEAEEYQQCILWRQDEDGKWQLDGDPESYVVNCGILGGEDHPYESGRLSGTQTATSAVQTEGLYIALQEEDGDNVVPVNHFCRIYNNIEEDGFITGFDDDDAIEAPCGIYDTARFRDDVDEGLGEVLVQVLTDSIRSRMVEAEVMSAFDVLAREVRIRRKEGADSVFSIYDTDDIENAVYEVLYNSANNVYEFNFIGDTFLTGDLFVSDGDITFDLREDRVFSIEVENESLTFRGANSGNRIDLISQNLLASIDNLELTGDLLNIDYGYINFLNGTGGYLLNIDKEGSEININADTNLLDGNNFWAKGTSQFLSEFSTKKDESVIYNNEDFNRLVTYDSVADLKNFRSRIVLRYVNVVSGTTGTIPKPNCLDVIEGSEEIYDSSVTSATGTNLARVVLVPITFRTYQDSFGNNQFYTHVAQDDGANWNLYFYFSGDGDAGGGAREDGSGSSLAMVYCDYSSIL